MWEDSPREEDEGKLEVGLPSLIAAMVVQVVMVLEEMRLLPL